MMTRNWKHLFITAMLAMSASVTAEASSRCSETPQILLIPATVSCSSLTTAIAESSQATRPVIYQVPVGTPPSGGWPVAIVYQGSFVPIEDFKYKSSQSFGLYYEGKTIQRLLDNGYAVIAPRAESGIFWQTNLSENANNYSASSDYTFLTNLFEAIANGQFGVLNPARMYAVGFSSGGYNSSRMAVSFPGKFKALAIQSGSYATCLGPVCSIPQTLPADHPPTLFLHGFIDPIVPWWSMDNYYDRLLYQGVKTERYTDATAGHEWLSVSPKKVVDWFNAAP